MENNIHEIIAKTRQIWYLEVNEKQNLIAFNLNKEGKWDVYIYSLKEKEVRKITQGNNSYLFPSFSHEGKYLLYHKDKEGDENYQIILRDLNNNAEVNLTNDLKHYYNSSKFSLDDKKIAMLSNRNSKPSQIFLYEEGRIEEITRWDEPIFYFEWLSNDEIIYVKGIYENEIRLVNIRTKKDDLLLKFEKSETYLGDVDPNKRKFLFYTNFDEFFDIGEYDLNSRSWKWLYKSNKEKYEPKYFNDSIAFVEFEDGENVLKQLSSSLKILAKGIADYEILGNSIVYIKNTSNKPDSLFIDDFEIIDNTPEELKGKLIEARSIYYESFDERKIHAMLYMPRNWNGIGVVNIHGGPDAHAFNSWNPLSQLLTLKGYLVIMPNYRGSTGFGKSFLHLNDKDLGGGDMKDVLYAAKYLKEMGAKKIVALGASYGGYLTALCLVKAPELWHAGVAIVGFYNWFTEFENEADYLKSYDSIKMDKSLFYDRSPIFFLDNLRAPILLIQSANDPRCPLEEVHQMADKLKSLGKDFELKIFEDEGHSIRKEKNRIEMYRLILDFLKRKLI